MSSSSTSPPSLAATPHTPPPAVRITLPTPPSFSARRRSYMTATAPPVFDTDIGDDEPRKVNHPRSVSFSQQLDIAESGINPRLYKIPQRHEHVDENSPLESARSEGSSARRGPPQPLLLNSRTRFAGPNAALSPYTKSIPSTAPASRFASTAISRGLSIGPALERGARHSISASSGSIWSAGFKSQHTGWISPPLSSARSTTTSGRTRGLTVAVLNDGKEMLLGDVPVTPGLGSATVKFGQGRRDFIAVIAEGVELNLKVNELSEVENADAGVNPKEVILCRYHHTPGLTCTSRPCRFVHNLEVPGTPQIQDALGDDMRSPTTHPGDPTMGIFAKAQSSARIKSLTECAAPGETVKVEDSNGNEVVGTVFLMSGGGNGPGGKIKEKYKTVPCKDFAEGHCAYGLYCSFLHEETPVPTVIPSPDIKVDEADNVRPDTSEDKLELKPDRIKRNSISALSAWTKALPRTVLVPSVKVNDHALDKQAKTLSAFAPPFLQEPIQVDNKGELVKEALVPQPTDIENTPLVPIPTEPAIKSAWAKGPPPALKKIQVVTADNKAGPKTPLSSSHLKPPTSAVSMFGTESDPATPWDPALRAKRFLDAEEGPHRSIPGDYNSVNGNPTIITPPLYPSPSEFPAFDPYISAYPWGMPMNPMPLPGYATDDSILSIPGGPGVMWTPAGWAVQDIAMKNALRGAEVKSRDVRAKSKKAKTYYKSRPCKFFVESDCPHGDRCSYLHVLPTQISVSSDSDTDRKIAKPANYRTTPCKFFNSSTGCTTGDSCAFLHTFVIPITAPLIVKPRPWRTRPCRHYQLGRCTLGIACHFAHVLEASRNGVCESWRDHGRCEKSGDCEFQHVGVGKEDYTLTETRMEQVMNEMRMGVPRGEEESDDEDEDEDDVEIVTDNTLPVTLGRHVSGLALASS